MSQNYIHIGLRVEIRRTLFVMKNEKNMQKNWMSKWLMINKIASSQVRESSSVTASNVENFLKTKYFAIYTHKNKKKKNFFIWEEFRPFFSPSLERRLRCCNHFFFNTLFISFFALVRAARSSKLSVYSMYVIFI